MPKENVFIVKGTVLEISEPQFLPNGAEVQTILVGWEDGDYKQQAAVDYYAAKGLEKLHEKKIAVGDTVALPCQPSSKLKEGEGPKGPYRFFQNQLRGDAWKAEVVTKSAEPIPF